jgi:glucose/arabinose dehydrogenase
METILKIRYHLEIGSKNNELVDNKLVYPKLLLNLPASSGPSHNGGKVLIGPDSNLYTVIGDLEDHVTKAQNSLTDVIGTGGILRVTPEGRIVGSGVLGKTDPSNKYYAYGIRNSFGMDFDP